MEHTTNKNVINLHSLLLEFDTVVLSWNKELGLHNQLDLSESKHLIEDMMWLVVVEDNIAVWGSFVVGGALVVEGSAEVVHLQKRGLVIIFFRLQAETCELPNRAVGAKLKQKGAFPELS